MVGVIFQTLAHWVVSSQSKRWRANAVSGGASLSFLLLFWLPSYTPSHSIQSMPTVWFAMTVTLTDWPGSIVSSSTWIVTVGPAADGVGVTVAVAAPAGWVG